MTPFARIPGPSDDFEDRAQLDAVTAKVGKRRRSTREANLGTFTGYRIGLDIGNGNIGWCVLFEEGRRLHFMTAEDISARNRSLPESATRTQLRLDGFVPLGVHKFEAREPKTGKSYSKVRAEARASRRLLAARQWRRSNVARELRRAGLLPDDGRGEVLQGRTDIKADVLRATLLDPSFEAHPHDLGRALRNALKRRGYMKPVGRAGTDEGSGFAEQAEAGYREAMERFGSCTIGEFLEKCAEDARRDGVRFRKRHNTLAEQRRTSPGEATESYDVFRFLSPTWPLIREECRMLRDRSGVEIDSGAWARIEKAAEFRRPLKGRIPGRCRHLPDRPRCVAALPSYQRFRIFEGVANLRDGDGRELDSARFAQAVGVLQEGSQATLAALSRELGAKLKLDRGDKAGSRRLAGAKTDAALGRVFGAKWTGLPIERRDDWTMRFLRRHWPAAAGEQPPEWTKEDTAALESDAKDAFGPDALAAVDDPDIANELEDKFTSLSVEAARLLADCYAERLSYDERMAKLKEAGAPESTTDLYEKLPYYGQAMPDIAVPAKDFAPEERTAEEERRHGRAANPDVHLVMNRLRAVVNAIIGMMGGILPTTCVIEMARSTFSEAQADAHRKTADARRKLRESIIADIRRILGSKTPTGTTLDNLVDRWKAAVRQGWRDYDGSPIQRSSLVDGATYQLDHVEPAAFGEFRENNMFVSRFNSRKGRRLPWEAFGGDPEFRPALLAFARFGLDRYIANAERRLQGRMPRRRRAQAQEALERARRERERLAEFGAPRPDVMAALRETVKSGGGGRRGGAPFRPGDQAALFRRFHPDRTRREGGPAARDIPNIGWSTKLARRYLRRVGADTEPIKAWAVHALRCMFGIDKIREDLRNHAVDALLTAHFDKQVLRPVFDRIQSGFGYEALYDRRALGVASGNVEGGDDLLEDFENNLDGLARLLPAIHAAHRANNRWNPHDGPGAGIGEFGKENIYSFRPSYENREKLTEFLRSKGAIPDGDRVLTSKEIIARYDALRESGPRENGIADKLASKIKLRRRRAKQDLVLKSAIPLTDRKGAFVDGSGKFAIVDGLRPKDRKVVSNAEFVRMDVDERAELFSAHFPVFRAGDTVIAKQKEDHGEERWQIFVVTGLKADTRLTVYPVNESGGKKQQKDITPDRNVEKFANDVLGRRLYRFGKTSGRIDPVPYPLRSQ